VNACPPKPRKRFAAVVLAAGASRRMGRPKALLDLSGRPLIAHLVGSFHKTASVERIFVVTGHQPEQIRQALSVFDVTFVHNPRYDSGGMISSVKAGVGAVAESCDAFFLCLLDQPLLQTRTVAEMAQAWSKTEPDLIEPAHDGQRGHPILIASRCVKKILSLSVDSTLRDFVAQHRQDSDVVEVSDPGVLCRLDTPLDYQHVLNLWRTLTCPTVSADPA
jgi:molybdenum cofactor cytidylyltransferase